MPNVNEMSREQLIVAVLPGVATDGDVTAAQVRLQKCSLHELRTMYIRQVASGILKPEPTQEELQAARTQAHERARQIAASDPQLQSDRAAVAEAQAATRKAFEDLAWSKFFANHPEVKDAFIVRQTLEAHARSMDENNALKVENLEQALRSNAAFLENFINENYIRPTAANLADDRATLEKFCRDNRLSYGGESCLRILRETFGAFFGGAAITEARDRGLIQLRPETDLQILAQWDHDDKVQRADFLRNHASPAELRAAVKLEGVKTAQQTVQTEFEHRQNITSQMQAHYPQLPPHINRAWLIKKSSAAVGSAEYNEFRNAVKKFGTAQVTALLQQQ